MIPLFIFVLLCTLFIFCADKKDVSKTKKEIMIGVKIYDYEGNFAKLFKEWQSLKINTAFLSETLLSNQTFRDLAVKNSVRLYVILPVFYDPEALKRNPDLYAITDKGEIAKEEWVEFVCPTREEFKEQRIADIKRIVSKFDPDGISIDFIRHFVFWEKIYPDRTLDSISNTCFDAHCLNLFEKETGIAIPLELIETEQKADWVTNNVFKDWTDWKCSVITRTVQNITEEVKKIKSDILVNIHAVPWRAYDFGGAARIIAGQDLTSISPYTDFVSPMCYSHMVKRSAPWINSVVNDMFNRTKGRIVPSIQVKEAYLPDILSVSEFEDALSEALKLPSEGVIFWSWDALDKDPPKKEVIKKLLKKRAK
jgi:hypothetical protein